MSIRFACTHCGHKMTADEFVAGTSITCDACRKLTMIPGVEREDEKPRLKTPKHPQVYEDVADTWKHCPECKTAADPRTTVCSACGFSFVTGNNPHGAKRPATALGSLVRDGVSLAVRVIALGLVVVLGFAGFVFFQKARLSREIRKSLGDGSLAVATEDYRRLASWYQWFQYLGYKNPYELRARQFQARDGKTYEKTRNAYFPLVVDRCVWGNRSQFFMKTAWVRFRFANVSKQSITVSREMFLLIGLGNNTALAGEVRKADPDPITIEKGEAIQGALYFGGMFNPPAFLEYNNGGLVVRAPVYVNYAMDNYERDKLDWPEGRGAEEFPLLKPWQDSKLEPKAVHVLWADYNKQPAPPAEPYTTVLKETNPR